MKVITQVIILFLFTLQHLAAQSVVEQWDEASDQVETIINEAPFSESINKIASSKRLLVLSNRQQKLFAGDFITLLQNDQPTIRALVVKTREDESVIKVIKTYDDRYPQGFNLNDEIQIIRGDDSMYFAQLKAKTKEALEKTPLVPENPAQEKMIKNDELKLSQDQQLFDRIDQIESQRAIKSDNLITGQLGYQLAPGIDGSDKRYLHYQIAWSRQMGVNWWIELGYGYSVLKKFPSTDIDAGVNTASLKFGKMFELPFYAFLLPYLGAEKPFVKAPDAGILLCDATCTTDDQAADVARANNELDLVDKAEEPSILFGVSFIKRLVPGWSMRVNIDNQLVGAGLLVEF